MWMLSERQGVSADPLQRQSSMLSLVRSLRTATVSFLVGVATVNCSPPTLGEDIVGSESSLTGAQDVGSILKTTRDTELLEDHSSDADVIEELSKGTRVKIVKAAPEGGWYKVSYKKSVGWVLGKHLKADDASGSSSPTTIKKTAQKDGTILASADGYEVVVDNKDDGVPESVVDGLLEVYFGVYGSMVQRFNRAAPKQTRWTFDPSYDGAAKTWKGQITFSSKNVKAHPKDLDVVTHESFHIVQSYFEHYNQPGCPSWAVEGLADWARYRYGLANAAADWALPDFATTQKVTDAFKVTARFFVWLENRVRPSLVDELHLVMRDAKYTDAFWKEKTGKSLEQLWSDYSKSPDIGESSNSSPGKTPTSVKVKWNAISSGTATYALDVYRNGERISPCLGTNVIGSGTQYTFKGQCIPSTVTVGLGQVTGFRVCASEDGIWTVCKEAQWDKVSDTVTIRLPD